MKKILGFLLTLTLLASSICSAQSTVQKADGNTTVPTDPKLMSLMANCCAGGPPANDNYAAATNLVIGAGATAGNTCGSTLQATEVYGCATYVPNQTVWYRFTATAGITYVVINYVGGNCYGGSAIWPSTGLPTTNCDIINCQDAVLGPNQTIYRLTTTIATTYYVQIVYLTGGGCGNGWCFNIAATNVAPGGTLTNPAYPTNCATASAGCYFTSTPTTPMVTGGCVSYPLATGSNLVNSGLYSFTTAATNANVVSFNDIITSTCGGGNVDWFMWKLYDASCTLIACGDLSNMTANVNCSTVYYVQYAWEQVNCFSYTNQYPYQYAPTGTSGCGVLPIELLSFTGIALGDNNSLKWECATETNNDYFILERSVDGFTFSEVARVDGSGNTSFTTRYSFIDSNFDKSVNYYRLKQVDFNGQSEYFNIIAVDNTTAVSNVTLVKRITVLGTEVTDGYEGMYIEVYSDGNYIKKCCNPKR